MIDRGSFIAFVIFTIVAITECSLNHPRGINVKKEFPRHDFVSDIKRISIAIANSTILAGESFISSALMFTPVGLVMNFPPKEGLKMWMRKGTGLAVDWATISALYSGSEELIAGFRGKRDRINTYISSGLTSAFVQRKDGISGMLSGFCIGIGLLVALDQLGDYSRSAQIQLDTSERGVPQKVHNDNRGDGKENNTRRPSKILRERALAQFIGVKRSNS